MDIDYVSKVPTIRKIVMIMFCCIIVNAITITTHQFLLSTYILFGLEIIITLIKADYNLYMTANMCVSPVPNRNLLLHKQDET